MRRVPTNTGKSVPNIEGEPDFFEIAKAHPVPPTSFGGLFQSSAPPANETTTARSAMTSSTTINRGTTTMTSSMSHLHVAAQDRDDPTPSSQMTNALSHDQHPRSPNGLLPSLPITNAYHQHPYHADNVWRPGIKEDGPLPAYYAPNSFSPYDANHLYFHGEYSPTSFIGQPFSNLSLLAGQPQLDQDQSKEQELEDTVQEKDKGGKGNESFHGQLYQTYSVSSQDEAKEQESIDMDDFSPFSWT